MPPKSAEECRERDEECERLALTASTAHTRETMLWMANCWRKLAAEDEAKEQSKAPQANRAAPPPR